MIKVSITGNIASGKSVVQSFLIKKGYKVLDTDDVSHTLLTIDNKELYRVFKDFDVFENGEFSREKLGKLIFSNETMRMKLNSIIHPQVEKEIEKFFLQNIDEEIVFVGIPLLFEAGMQNLFDKIIFIYTDDDIRLKRLIKRNNYTKEYAKKRMASQIPQEQKVMQSDIVINNNGSVEELEDKIMQPIRSFLRSR